MSDAPAVVAEPRELCVDIISDELEFMRIREKWEELVECAAVTPFQTFTWCFLWWNYFGNNPERKLHILLFRYGDRVVGIGPLFLESETWFGLRVFRRARFLGCDVAKSPVSCVYHQYPLTDYLDFVVSPDFEHDVARCFVKFLQNNPLLYDQVDLVNVPCRSFIWRNVLPELVASGFAHRIDRADECPQIVLPSTMEAYLASLHSSHRRRLRQAMRLLDEEGEVTIEKASTAEQMERMLGELVRLHQLRWNKAGYPGLFFDKRFEMFQRDVLKEFLSRGWVWLKTVQVAGKVVAVRLGFAFKGVLYDYVGGFDHQARESKGRPGLALLCSMIDDAIREKFSVVDLLRGGEQYKHELATKLSRNWNLFIENPMTRRTMRDRAVRAVNLFQNMYQTIARENLVLSVLLREYGSKRMLPRYAGMLASRMASRLHLPSMSPLSTFLREKSLDFVRLIEGKLRMRPLIGRMSQSLRRDKELPFSRKLFKALIYVRSLLLSRIYLRRCTRVGKRCRTRGKPFIVNDGQIIIGDDFNLNSRIVQSELATGHRGVIEIGHEVTINFGALISAQEHVRIGNRVRIGPYSIITDSDFHTIGDRYSPPTGVPTIIEDGVWLGARVTVLKGSRIKEGAVIAAGSVVSGEIPPHVIAAGVPARVVRQTHSSANRRTDIRPSNSIPSDIVTRVSKVFVETFALRETPELSATPRHILRWDSLGHLNLILRLESEFGIAIAEDDVMMIGSVRDACLVVVKSTNGHSGVDMSVVGTERFGYGKKE
ncbi:MAG TPA: GNAT family N-acetyltransferase [Bacteroidota bacterium]|nr:GNAT family N-acetyltransferase [Bacteroidota bacterium]